MHPLRQTELYKARKIGRARAAVKVERLKSGLVIVANSISVLRLEAIVVPIPDRLHVVSEDGEVIQPSKGSLFLITTETFDPYHLVTELPEGEW